MKRILIVDDNLMMRKFIRNIFMNEQYEIMEAENGSEGLDIVKKFDIDLVITDIIMPVMEGLELIMHLKRDFPEIKIIAISGGKPYYLYMAKKLGIEKIFTKPLNLHQFLDAVKKLIQFPKSGIISSSASA
ncbi:MAG: response regulator [Bacteroidales bacterium]|nr:response regulator [Bacteroidales bacterium]